MAELWAIYKDYFLGKSLEEELSFSNYFHQSPYNKIIHLINQIIFPVAFYILFSIFLPNLIGLVIIFIYVASFYPLSKFAFSFYLISHSILILVLLPYQNILLLPSILHLILFGPINIFSHAKFEGFIAEFRGFEIFITTPVTLAIWFSTFSGINTNFWEKVVQLTPKWKGNKYELKPELSYLFKR
jgi:hypothetical protein